MDGGSLKLDRCWFQGFDAAIGIQAFGTTVTQISQTMIVPGPGPGPGTTSAPELRGWALSIELQPGGAKRKLTLDHCTIEGAGFLSVTGGAGRVPTPDGDQAVRRAGRSHAGLAAPQARRSPGSRCRMEGRGESAPGARAGLDHGVAQDDDPRDRARRHRPGELDEVRRQRGSIRPRPGSCITRSPTTGPTRPGPRTSPSSRPSHPCYVPAPTRPRSGRGGNSILPRPSRGSPHFDPVRAFMVTLALARSYSASSRASSALKTSLCLIMPDL